MGLKEQRIRGLSVSTPYHQSEGFDPGGYTPTGGDFQEMGSMHKDCSGGGHDTHMMFELKDV